MLQNASLQVSFFFSSSARLTCRLTVKERVQRYQAPERNRRGIQQVAALQLKGFLSAIKRKRGSPTQSFHERWSPPKSLMLPSVSRCTRHITVSLSVTRSLAHFRPHMDPDPNRPVERTIRTKLTDKFKPDHLEVHNESYMHAVPPGSETHFRVLVVSSQFAGLPLIQRHRLVNEVLKEELSSCVHALAIQAKAPEQWGMDPTLGKSPPCMGGSKGDPTVEEKLKAGRD